MFSSKHSRWVVAAVIAALVVALMPVLQRAEADGPIAYGDVVSGKLNNLTYFELWAFDGQKGDRVKILMEGDGQLDPYVGLIDQATEQVLAEDDDSGGNGNAYIETTLPAAGAYIIVATRYGFDQGTSQGQYQLSLTGGSGPQNVSNTTTTGGVPVEVSPGVFYMGDIAFDSQVSGNITGTAFGQVYTIELQQGTDIAVAMFADASALDPYLVFATIDGEVLAEDDDSGAQVGGSSTDAYLRLTAPTAGVYMAIATRAGLDTGLSTGNYVLFVGAPQQTQPQQTELPPGMEMLGEVTVGGTVSGTISATSYVHFYELQGTAGQQVTITMTGTGGLDAYLGLMDPNDEVIAEDDDSGGGTNAQIAIRLPESGYYWVIATRNGIDEGTTTGSYTLTVVSGPPPAPQGVTATGGFGGLPGRAFQTDEATFYLRGFGRSTNPDKATPLQSFLQSARGQSLPGRSLNVGGESFRLSGFGRSADPAKATPLQRFLSTYLNG